jgi:hypothetical protein
MHKQTSRVLTRLVSILTFLHLETVKPVFRVGVASLLRENKWHC